uniref:HNH/ENDO VII family nuclease n=1 Tax=Rheinheimera baltica TaxID=67576 RepID=UPI00196A0F9A
YQVVIEGRSLGCVDYWQVGAAALQGAFTGGVGSRSDLHRPYVRKHVRETVESRAKRMADGRFRDANTGLPINGKYDLGHKRGHEFRREKVKAEAEGLTQKQFNDRMNNPNLYQIEHPSLNRSHKFEKPGK